MTGTRTQIASFLLAGSAALTLTATAQACRDVYNPRVFENSMAEWIGGASQIALAMPVEAVPTEQRGTFALFSYSFEVTEVLHGESLDAFQIDGSAPFDPTTLRSCERDNSHEYYSACYIAVRNENRRQTAHSVAERGREDWEAFYYLPTRTSQSGMGAAEHYDESETITVGCGRRAASFELGETFLVFLDEYGRPLADPLGLNNHLITRSDDAWLAAVRTFVANPGLEKLPARSLQDALMSFGRPITIQADVCGAGRMVDHLIVRDVVSLPDREPLVFPDIEFPYPHDGPADLIDACQYPFVYLMFEQNPEWLEDEWHSMSRLPLFPIQDGLVNFSAFQPQWEVVGDRQVRLDEVMSWWDRD